MSSDDDSSGSEGEDLSTTGLIANRAKRATAGNLYATLRQNLDDEELQKALLEEDEDDVGEYEESDKDDDDAMSSSGDEDDAGPPNDADKEDLEGEQELKRAERADNKKKRKLEEAKKRIPNWQKKRVKQANDAKAEDGQPAKLKKKSERSNWLPTAADAPTRQSSRALAVANREMVHTNLKESNERSEKQKTVMNKHKERLKAQEQVTISQQDRLVMAKRIEKETAREFGKWEREEAERQRARDAQLAAKRNRVIDGPVIRYWSGSVLWEGDKIKNQRLHGSQNVGEIKDKPKQGESSADGDVSLVDSAPEGGTAKTSGTSFAAPTNAPSNSVAMTVATPGFAGSQPLRPLAALPQQIPPQPIISAPQTNTQPSWLDGIHAYANQPDPTPSSAERPSKHPLTSNQYTPSTPSINAPPNQPAPRLPPSAPQPPGQYSIPPQPTVYHGRPSNTGSYNQFHMPTAHHQPLPPPTPPPPPLIREQARRSLIILEQFEDLESNDKGKKSASKSKDMTLEPTALASALLGRSAYPCFNAEESRYLTSKLKRLTASNKGTNMSLLPHAPAKQRCAFTPFPAKFRDPKTGLPYADMLQYKNIQRLLAGGCQWSSVLGCWVGPVYGSIGRAAVGVPEGFCSAVEEEEKQMGWHVKTEEKAESEHPV